MNNMIEEGKAVPKFQLQDADGNTIKSSQLKGKKYVVYFYPRDFTPGCTTEACSFRDNIFEFKALNTQILGVSLDDVDSHQEFSEKYE